MAKYVSEVARLFTSLSLQHVESVAKTLTIDQIKILQLEVLPRIPAERRKEIKEILMQSEKQLYVRFGKKEVLTSALKEQQAVSEQVKSVFDSLTRDILINLKKEEVRKIFFQKATEDELEVLERKLKDIKLGEYEKPILLELEKERKKRAENKPKSESSSKQDSQKKHNLQWEVKIWEQLSKSIEEDYFEFKSKMEVKPKTPPPKESPPLVKKTWYKRAWEGFKNIFNSPPKEPEPYELKLPENHEEEFDSLRQAGAKHVAETTGLVRVGEVEALSLEGRKRAMHTRFGMVLASQVVAGTKTENHGILYSVLASLSKPEDSDSTIQSLQATIDTVVSKDSPLQGNHACATGGHPEFVTAFESEVLKNLINSPESFSEYGLHLSEQEKEQIETYHKNMGRSRDLNNALSAICYSWGGYTKDPETKGYKKHENFEERQQKFEKNIAVASKGMQEACDKLEDGQSLYLETGVENHAMQLVITKVGKEFKITTYDSAGALENTSLSKGPLGLLQLSQFRNTEAKRKNAYTFTIPQERLISSQGLDYLGKLIRSNSMVGWAETHIAHDLQHTTRAERSQMWWPRRLYHEVQTRKRYQIYMDLFGSIALPDSPPNFEEILQHPQNTSNCFAKKTQACEFYELGKGTYKKVRLATLIQQKENLLKDIESEQDHFVSMEFAPMLNDIEPQYLSPAELHEVSLRLCEAKEPPSIDYYKRFFGALLEAKEKLEKEPNETNKLAISRINEKIGSYAQSYYQYLKERNPGEIDKVFTEEVTKGTFDWKSGVMPFKKDSEGNIDYALTKISEFASAQAWKASLQMLNHQIVRLSVNERHISSPSERLSHASSRQVVGKVTLSDLENANVVNFTTGFTRQEETQIELNVGGTRKEIDKATFFELVVKNNDALTNPKVMRLLDYLRNSSLDVEKRYMKEVYPTQKKAFEDKLEESKKSTERLLENTILKLNTHKVRLTAMLAISTENIRLIEKEIKAERENNNGKSTIKLKNLEARLPLLKQEHEEINRLIISISTKIDNLQLGSDLDGSMKSKIAKAAHILKQFKNSSGLTINQVNQSFIKAKRELESVEKEVTTALNKVEVEVEHEINDRLIHINHFRQTIVSDDLQTNHEYRILDKLAQGHMGNKPGKNTFKPGSVFDEIQSLNQKLKTRVGEIVEREAIIGTDTLAKASISSCGSANDQYAKLEEQLSVICKRPIPQEVKAEWVREMFAIWLKRENPEILHKITKSGLDPTLGVNRAFHHFIEQQAQIKYGDLKAAGYEIDLNLEQIEKMGWKPVGTKEIEEHRQKRKEAALFIMSRFSEIGRKFVSKTRVKEPKPEPVSLGREELTAQHNISEELGTFVPPEVVFLSLTDREALDGSTLKFLRENPIPRLTGTLPEQCEKFFSETKNYLQKLKSPNGLENKSQRISEFCHLSAATIFKLPNPPKALVEEITKNILDDYRDENKSLSDSFLKLENSERSQLLTSLIKLSLTQIPVSDSEKTSVNSKFYSTVKQWEKLIDPPDVEMSKKIAMLQAGGLEPQDIELFKEVDIALHQSPVSLEGIYEGQKGIQVAISTYGKESIPTGVDSDLRKLADRLGMRNGDALLPQQFVNYYSKPNLLQSSGGLNSTQGRELFSRAFLDAYRHGTPSEKKGLLDFIQKLKFDDSTYPCTLKTSHQVFIDEMLLRCSSLDPSAFKEYSEQRKAEYTPVNAELFIDSLTKSTSTEGTDRLFGFAKEVNILSLQIEHALKSDPVDNAKLDALYSKLICSNLAFQLMLDQASEETISNLNENFEFTREMALAQVNMDKLQSNLIDFSSNLNSSSKFYEIFSKYVEDKKFDGPPLLAKSASSSDIPGFISLGGNRTLDVIHGVVYVGNNKLGMMPAHLQSHISVEELGINQLPFRPLGGGYSYSEGKDIKAFIMPKEDGTLTIQRELVTFDGTPQMLQYISPEKMDTVPMAIRRGLNAEHFFVDSKGTMYGFTADFKPILKLSSQDEVWSGVILDHQGNKVAVNLDHTVNASMIKDLARVFPEGEMISVDESTVYIPSLLKYVTSNPETGSYFITDSLTEISSKKHLIVSKEGSGLTEKVLSESESNAIISLNKEIEKLKEKLSNITKSDLVSQQEKSNIAKKIQECEAHIKEIKNPEYFIFVAESQKIKTLGIDHARLRNEMLNSYIAYRGGGKKDKEKLGVQYEQAKEDYVKSNKELQKAYAEANHLRVFDVHAEKLKAKDFISALYMGRIAGKTELLTQYLSANTLKTPLKPNELEELKQLKEQFKENPSLTKEERIDVV